MKMEGGGKWCTKMEILYWEKAFHATKKIWKNDFALSEKFPCYAPAFDACISPLLKFIALCGNASRRYLTLTQNFYYGQDKPFHCLYSVETLHAI